jgi:hypothetical protein
METGKVTRVHDNDNVVDVDGNELAMSSVGNSSYINNGQNCVNDINRFLERPIKIYQAVLNSGTISQKLDLWDILSKNGRIRSKFEKFAYFKGDIEISIAISGTPFHYGKVLVSYQPHPTHNQSLIALEGRLVVDPVVYRPMFLNYLSQSRGAKVMDVKDNQPLMMHIPFISHKPQWRLFNSDDLIVRDTSFEDFANSGSLYIYTINDVGAVTTTPSEVSIIVYANFKDVNLGTLTGTSFVAESLVTKESEDEQKTGPIQKYASNAANFLHSASSIPEIAPFTVPASLVMKGVSGIASIFGWSKPILTENRSQIKPDGFNNGSVCIGNDTAKVIGVDPKRTLEISQGMFGSNDDEMVIEHIANRLSYFHTFQWSTAYVPFVTSIFEMGVSPYLLTNASQVKEYFQPTALAFSAAPFLYWRGDIEVVFEFVVSSYHRGKIAVVYEPNVRQKAVITTTSDLNEQYVKIIDLQETQTVSFCVNWASDRPWRKVGQIPTDSWFGDIDTDIGQFCNGFLYLYAVNYLQSPDDSSISVNVYVRGKNMHYAVPIAAGLPSNRDGYNAEALFTTEVTCFELNESTASQDNIHLSNFGESIPSFRSLLKRYHRVADVTLSSSSLSYAQVTAPIYPRNNAPFGSSASDYLDLFSYLRLAYLGVRGSARHRIKFIGGSEMTYMEHVNVLLDLPSSFAPPDMTVTSTNTYFPITLTGGVTFLPNVNSAVEIDLPFYTTNLWLFSQPNNLVGFNGADEMETDFIKSFSVIIPQLETVPAADTTRIIDEFATGEDFNFHYFTGAVPFNL